ncbi:MAG: glutaminase [Bacteroidia bacterium]|nr:glutaminase [Bacteroidia bacterium]
MIDYQGILEDIYTNLLLEKNKGQVASYIPELSKRDLNKLGIHLNLINGNSFSIGDFNTGFSIQSISKIFTLAMAFSLMGNELWKRVNVEPSGNPFNHLSLLEQENGIPRNPLINAGAIVIADILLDHFDSPKAELLSFIRKIAGDLSIDYNKKVAASEKMSGFRNYAAANLLKSFDNLNNPVEDVLDFYFHQCSIEMNCKQLANAIHLFSNHGVCQQNIEHITSRQAKRINAIMLTCGFYDEAGEFAFEVGLPGKSGVGGGIAALLPNEFTITTWSPGLNSKGNSLLGMQALEQFTTKTGLSIF